jgi:hypothetical protein
MASSFDKEILESINKKQCIEAMSGLYSHIPPAIIEQFYDFCSNKNNRDLNDYLYYKSEYENLSANELKKYYKLENKYRNLFKNAPIHKTYKNDEVLEETITFGKIENN